MADKFNIASKGIEEAFKADTITMDNDEKLKLYGLYKQATTGPNTTEAPWAINVKDKAKWQAWKDLGSLSSDEAKVRYVQLAKPHLPANVRDQL